MANFSYGSGITFPSPQPMQYAAPLMGMTCFTPNSTSTTNNLMFPSPASSSFNSTGAGGILCSGSDSRPTSSHCMASSRHMPAIQWAPNSVASPEMTMFNAAAANFSSMAAAPASPVPSTSGISQNASLNRSKRKSDVTDFSGSEEPEPKILVNEERMAARMQELHLDNNNLDWHPDLEDQQQQQQQQRNNETWFSRASTRSPNSSPSPEPGVTLTNCSTSSSSDYDSEDSSSVSSVPSRRARSKSCPKLDFSPELQLTLKTQRLLPKVILDELNKPCMQVMLWKPAGGVEDIMAGVEAAAKASEAVKNPSHPVQVSEKDEMKEAPTPPLAPPSLWAVPAGQETDKDIGVEVDLDDDDDMDL